MYQGRLPGGTSRHRLGRKGKPQVGLQILNFTFTIYCDAGLAQRTPLYTEEQPAGKATRRTFGGPVRSVSRTPTPLRSQGSPVFEDGNLQDDEHSSEGGDSQT